MTSTTAGEEPPTTQDSTEKVFTTDTVSLLAENFTTKDISVEVNSMAKAFNSVVNRWLLSIQSKISTVF